MYWSTVDLQCCVSFRCTAKWISYTDTYVPSFFSFFSHLVITEYWFEFPMLYSRSLLLIYFIYSSVYMLRDSIFLSCRVCMGKYRICQTLNFTTLLGPVRSCTEQVWMSSRVTSCPVLPAESLDHRAPFDLKWGISTWRGFLCGTWGPLLFFSSAQMTHPRLIQTCQQLWSWDFRCMWSRFFRGQTVHPVPPQSPPPPPPPNLGSESLESPRKTELRLPVGPHGALGRGRGCESYLCALVGALGCSEWWGLWLPLCHAYFHRKHGCGCICMNHKMWKGKKLNWKSVWQNN